MEMILNWCVNSAPIKWRGLLDVVIIINNNVRVRGERGGFLFLSIVEELRVCHCYQA